MVYLDSVDAVKAPVETPVPPVYSVVEVTYLVYDPVADPIADRPVRGADS